MTPADGVPRGRRDRSRNRAHGSRSRNRVHGSRSRGMASDRQGAKEGRRRLWTKAGAIFVRYRRCACIRLAPARFAKTASARRSKPESRPPEPEQNRLCPDVGNRIGIDALAFSSVPQNQIVIRRKRLRFGEEPRQNEREVTFAKKVAANDMSSAATWNIETL